MIAVMIAHDYPVMIYGLRMKIESAGFAVKGTASSVFDIPGTVEHHRPDVLVIGTAMLIPKEIGLLKEIRQAAPDTRVLVFSECSCKALTDSLYADEADGYVLLDNTADSLIQALLEISKGRHYVSPNIAQALQTSSAKQDSSGFCGENSINALTPREIQILRLVAEGLRNVDIADRLSIARRTVEAHRSNLMQKLELNGKSDLIRYALKHGYIAMQETGRYLIGTKGA